MSQVTPSNPSLFSKSDYHWFLFFLSNTVYLLIFLKKNTVYLHVLLIIWGAKIQSFPFFFSFFFCGVCMISWNETTRKWYHFLFLTMNECRIKCLNVCVLIEWSLNFWLISPVCDCENWGSLNWNSSFVGGLTLFYWIGQKLTGFDLVLQFDFWDKKKIKKDLT